MGLNVTIPNMKKVSKNFRNEKSNFEILIKLLSKPSFDTIAKRSSGSYFRFLKKQGPYNIPNSHKNILLFYFFLPWLGRVPGSSVLLSIF